MTITRRNHGKGHTYRLDGTKAPGVTTILRETTNKSALIDWAGRTTAAYAVDNWDELAAMPPSKRLNILDRARFTDRDTAARRGTQVHRLGEKLVAGEEVRVPDELAGHVDSYVDFLNRVDPSPLAVEQVVANHTEFYCGTIDLIADIPIEIIAGDMIYPPGRWLLDLKTSRSGVFPESALQLCGYLNAETFAAGEEERPMSWLQIDHAGVVHIRADGWDLRPCSAGPDVWEHFRHLCWLYHHSDEESEWIGQSAEPPALPVAVGE